MKTSIIFAVNVNLKTMAMIGNITENVEIPGSIWEDEEEDE